jgi:hypothetical protein
MRVFPITVGSHVTLNEQQIGVPVAVRSESGHWVSGRRFRVLLCASGMCFMIMLNSNIVAVSLPSIARDLGAAFSDVEWVVSAYVLTFGRASGALIMGIDAEAAAAPVATGCSVSTHPRKHVLVAIFLHQHGNARHFLEAEPAWEPIVGLHHLSIALACHLFPLTGRLAHLKICYGRLQHKPHDRVLRCARFCEAGMSCDYSPAVRNGG